MRKISFLLLYISFLTLLSSCADSPEMVAAEGACQCTSELETKLSPNTVNIIIEATDSENPSQFIQDKLKSMDSAQAITFLSQDMEILWNLDKKNSDFYKCMKQLEEKFNNQFKFDKEETIQTVLMEMKKDDCAFGYALLKQEAEEKKKK